MDRGWTLNLIIILVILDSLTTYIGIEYVGLQENNPVVVWLIQEVGIVVALLVSPIIVISTIILGTYYLREQQKDPIYILSINPEFFIITTHTFVITFYLVVLSNNLYLILFSS